MRNGIIVDCFSARKPDYSVIPALCPTISPQIIDSASRYATRTRMPRSAKTRVGAAGVHLSDPGCFCSGFWMCRVWPRGSEGEGRTAGAGLGKEGRRPLDSGCELRLLSTTLGFREKHTITVIMLRHNDVKYLILIGQEGLHIMK